MAALTLFTTLLVRKGKIGGGAPAHTLSATFRGPCSQRLNWRQTAERLRTPVTKESGEIG